MADDFSVNSNTDILEFKRKFNLFVSNYDKGEFDGDFEITGDLTVDGDVEIKGELKGAETQIANAVSTYISEHPFDPEMIEGQDIAPDDISATGNITAPSIIETMTGYSFTKATSTETITKTYVYCGVAKNGNKITFVWFLKINMSASQTGNSTSLGAFRIPKEVGNQIYPYTLSEISTVIASDSVNLAGSFNDRVATPYLMFKEQNPNYDSIGASLYNLQNLTLNKDYLVRVEQTFLLSENLASNE